MSPKKIDNGEECCLSEIENKLCFSKEKTNQECKIIWERVREAESLVLKFPVSSYSTGSFLIFIASHCLFISSFLT